MTRHFSAYRIDARQVEDMIRRRLNPGLGVTSSRKKVGIAHYDLQFKCIEGAGESRQVVNEWWEVTHWISMRPSV